MIHSDFKHEISVQVHQPFASMEEQPGPYQETLLKMVSVND